MLSSSASHPKENKPYGAGNIDRFGKIWYLKFKNLNYFNRIDITDEVQRLE